MTHKGTVILETERLILRRFTNEDAEAIFHNWASDDVVTKFLSWPTHRTVETAKRVCSSWVESYQREDFYQWAIVLKEHGSEPIGTIDSGVVDEQAESVYVGYALGKAWWGQGIMTEAYKAVMAFLFEEVGVQRIESRHDVNNPASGRVMQKAGLTYEGTLRKSYKNNQGIADHSYYSILRSEYKK